MEAVHFFSPSCSAGITFTSSSIDTLPLGAVKRCRSNQECAELLLIKEQKA